jgi:hypothetical protein
MKERMNVLGLVTLTTLFLSFSLMFAILNQATAAAETKEIDGMSYNVNAPLEENLKTLTGKRIYVTLDSGHAFCGTLKTVGTHLIHLEKLDQKDFFDALIRIEDISAVDAKFRDFAR